MAELAETISLKNAKKERDFRELVLSGKGKLIMDKIREKLEEMTQEEDRLLVERQKSAAEAQSLSSNLALGSLVAITGISFLISVTIARTITRSLGIALGVAERVYAGDLTAEIEVTSEDEIGKLMAAIKTMNKSLNSLISQVQQSGIQVTSSSTQIAASGKQLEATVQEQVASTNEVVATAKEIAATSG
jgi:methyl-accepting chemotaxis protein WspA